MPKTVKFIHCRYKNADGSVMPTGGLTIAYNLNNEYKVVGWAAAKCHIKDHYNKHVGRAKAEGRLLSAKYFELCNEMDESEFITKTQLGFNKEFPIEQ